MIEFSLSRLDYPTDEQKRLIVRTPRPNEVVVAHRTISDQVCICKKGSLWHFLHPGVFAKMPKRKRDYAQFCMGCAVQDGAPDAKQFFLWILKKDSPSAHHVARKAQQGWIRVSSPKKGSYTAEDSKEDYGDPEWPFKSIDDAFRDAFDGRLILTEEQVHAFLGVPAH